MRALDLIFLVLMGILALRGYLKGFTGELFSVASLALALAASLLCMNAGAFIIRAIFQQELLQRAPVPEIIAFALIFLTVFVTGKFAGRIVKGIVTNLSLGGIDKLLGLFFGFAEALALIALALFLLNIQPFFDPEPLLEHSFFARLLLPLISGGGVEYSFIEGESRV